ncbi:pseudouridine synthase [Aureococcus anophagefferens]|nr:pseudouridine synthase [Aureococcus anophagefferens]
MLLMELRLVRLLVLLGVAAFSPPPATFARVAGSRRGPAPTTTSTRRSPTGGLRRPPARLDAFLAAQFPERTRREWAEAIGGGAVRVNGAVATRKSASVAAGDGVAADAFAAEPAGDKPVEAEDLPLDVLVDDASFLVVNKAAGMVTHPAPGARRGTANAVAPLRRRRLRPATPRPGIVHRLDRYTSGAIVVARNARATRRLQAQFKARTVAKLYLAVLAGPPPPPPDGADELVIDAPIGRHPARREKMAVVAIDRGPHAHQIRVHLAHVGSPVLGDPVYGDAQANARAAAAFAANRTLLRRGALAFDHPTRARQVTAPPPPDLARAGRRRRARRVKRLRSEEG